MNGCVYIIMPKEFVIRMGVISDVVWAGSHTTMVLRTMEVVLHVVFESRQRFV